jgi:hypothetical protein
MRYWDLSNSHILRTVIHLVLRIHILKLKRMFAHYFFKDFPIAAIRKADQVGRF